MFLIDLYLFYMFASMDNVKVQYVEIVEILSGKLPKICFLVIQHSMLFITNR